MSAVITFPPISSVLAAPIHIGTFLTAALPTPPATGNGTLAFAIDGLKVGEVTHGGTGVTVCYSNGLWRVQSTDAPVTS